MRRFALLAYLVVAMTGVHAGELYRWVDSSGKVYYGDAPPSDAKKIEARKLPDDVPSVESQPYQVSRARQDFPVTLYTSDGCGEPCDLARGLLAKRGVPFTEKLLRTRQEVDELKKLSGYDTAPTLSVGKSFLNGFLDTQWHDELDIAGYPKTPSYHASGRPGEQ